MERTVREITAHLEDLPLLPGVVTRIMKLNRDAEAYFKKILPMAGHDPVFALRRIRLANWAGKGVDELIRLIQVPDHASLF